MEIIGDHEIVDGTTYVLKKVVSLTKRKKQKSTKKKFFTFLFTVEITVKQKHAPIHWTNHLCVFVTWNVLSGKRRRNKYRINGQNLLHAIKTANNQNLQPTKTARKRFARIDNFWMSKQLKKEIDRIGSCHPFDVYTSQTSNWSPTI